MPQLQQLRALGLPARCEVNHLVSYGAIRARDALHLLASLCWQRQQKITDNLVELLIHIADRVSVRADSHPG